MRLLRNHVYTERAYTEHVAGYDFNLVSPTALYPVFARGEFTDIPFARQMLDRLRTGTPFPPDAYPHEVLRSYAPFFEARFKSVNHILVKENASQILELAAGFSPRGMEWSGRGTLYVETDLADMMERKRSLIEEILGSVPENLKLCSASALDLDELAAACACFRNQPVAVTTEGLLRYLTFPEKTQLLSLA